ncbi:MAG: hypothetical protein V5A24_03865 [Haloarculaceae archaeon]
MTVSRLTIALVAVLVTVAFVLLIAASLLPGSSTTEATCVYSVTLGTDATLANVTLLVPLPAAADGSPVAAAIRGRTATVPADWRAEVVETERGPAVRLGAPAVLSSPVRTAGGPRRTSSA